MAGFERKAGKISSGVSPDLFVTDTHLEKIVSELKQIDDPMFAQELMEHLDRLSLHKKRTLSFEDVDRLFYLAFRFANKNLEKEHDRRNGG